MSQQLEALDALTRAQDLARKGHLARAHSLALELHEDARRMGDQASMARSADLLAYVSVMLARYENGLRFARCACHIWQIRAEPVRQARSIGTLAMLLAHLGEAGALVQAEAATALATDSGDAGALEWALQSQCLALVLLAQPERAQPVGERAVGLGLSHGIGAVWARLTLSEALIWSALQARAADPGDDEPVRIAPGEVARPIQLTRQALALARRHGDAWLERLMVNNVAEYSLYAGDAQTAAAALAEFSRASGEPDDRTRAHHMVLQSRLHTMQGRDGDALAALLQCRTLLTSDDLELASMCAHDLSRCHARRQEFAPALAAYREYHELYVRRASLETARRVRLSALQQEVETLRAETSEAQVRAADLAASNEALAGEAQRLLRTSLEDPLTGLPNRRRLGLAFLDLLATGQKYCLAMIDVDHFKQVNDRFSHQIGDAVLLALADLLLQGTRPDDLVVRYGGEEFAMLIRHGERGFAEHICERLRKTVREHSWDSLQDGLAISVSIGVAASHEAETHDGVIAVADRRLYQAKQAGRNRVVA